MKKSKKKAKQADLPQVTSSEYMQVPYTPWVDPYHKLNERRAAMDLALMYHHQNPVAGKAWLSKEHTSPERVVETAELFLSFLTGDDTCVLQM